MENSNRKQPRVIHQDNANSTSAYIGRPSKYGNPFHIGIDGTREEVITKYKDWLNTQPDLIKLAKQELRGRDLACWCAPLPCHGDVLLEIVNQPTEPSILEY